MAGSGEQRAPRTLILCFDGTSNEYDTDVSIISHVDECLDFSPCDGLEHECCQTFRSSEEGL